MPKKYLYGIRMDWEEWDSNWYAAAGNHFVTYNMPENPQSGYISEHRYKAKNLYADNGIDLYGIAPNTFTEKLENREYGNTFNRYMKLCMNLFTKAFIVKLTENVSPSTLEDFISSLYDSSSDAMRCLFDVSPDEEDLIKEINRSQPQKCGYYFSAVDIQRWTLQTESLEDFASKINNRFICISFPYYQDQDIPIDYESDIYEEILKPFDINAVVIDGDQYNFNERVQEFKHILEN